MTAKGWTRAMPASQGERELRSRPGWKYISPLQVPCSQAVQSSEFSEVRDTQPPVDETISISQHMAEEALSHLSSVGP